MKNTLNFLSVVICFTLSFYFLSRVFVAPNSVAAVLYFIGFSMIGCIGVELLRRDRQ